MSTLTISTADNTIINTVVDNNTGLLTPDDGNVDAGSFSAGGVTIPEGAKPIYGSAGVPLFSTAGLPLYESIVKESDDPDGYQVIDEATITIDWSASGIGDLDCCAHWADNSSHQIGWSHGQGGLWDDNYTAWWTYDDTGGGPETIALLTHPNARSSKESSPYQYQVHLNFYGDASSGTPTATVTITRRGVTLSKTITPSTNQGQAATISDPAVTITFDASGKPISIS